MWDLQNHSLKPLNAHAQTPDGQDSELVLNIQHQLADVFVHLYFQVNFYILQ